MHDDLALCSIKNRDVLCRVLKYRMAEMLHSMPIYHFALRGLHTELKPPCTSATSPIHSDNGAKGDNQKGLPVVSSAP